MTRSRWSHAKRSTTPLAQRFSTMRARPSRMNWTSGLASTDTAANNPLAAWENATETPRDVVTAEREPAAYVYETLAPSEISSSKRPPGEYVSSVVWAPYWPRVTRPKASYS